MVLKKDDLRVVCEVWCSFKNLTGKDNHTMDQFLNEYEKKVKALQRTELPSIPEVVMAMQLTDGAGLDKKDNQIVLTVVDYKKKEEMYDQMNQNAKNALRFR
ncbi:hypothetical protein HOLleu_28725 [Holothuria leucospilota]|uniref:Uncharacterized protein n=1 Tax=Holothuria leucospilota TaxID=206669 RepID=A0A9Q1GYM6_HOLLE|nr:hypothetical protein HOLleu_28725 [Holothuria leucospilota]